MFRAFRTAGIDLDTGLMLAGIVLIGLILIGEIAPKKRRAADRAKTARK